MTTIAAVDLELIDPHPHNPRRDVGDLDELVRSIEAQGIRQNLLVVPHPDDPGRYMAVIGHRRLAAAQVLMLPDVPAVIDDTLTPAQQIELMLVENLQRTDLTPVEEAQGYQDMLDLGVKVRAIATQTGRSEKTVTARLKLLKLPEAAQQKIHTHQATLEDAAALEQFAGDPKLTKKLIGALGTPQFGYELLVAKREVKLAREREVEITRLETLGVTKYTGKKPRDTYSPPEGYRGHYGGEPYPEGAVWLVQSYGVSVYVPKPAAEADADAAVVAKNETFKARQKRAEEEALLAWECRGRGVRALLALTRLPAKYNEVVVAHYAELLRGKSRWRSLDEKDVQKYLDKGDSPQVAADALARWTPYQQLLLAIHMEAGDASWNWEALRNGGQSGTDLEVFYRCLVELDYTLSDLERAAIDAGAAARKAAAEDLVDAEVDE